MDYKMLKEAIEILGHVKSILFNNRLVDFSVAKKVDGGIEFHGINDKILIDEDNGEMVILELIDCINNIDNILSTIISDLKFESNFEDPEKIKRIKTFLAEEIETSIHLFGVFSVGYIDVNDNYISVADFQERKAEMVDVGGFSILLKKEILKINPRSITYRKIVFAISLHLYKWFLKIEELSDNIERLIINDTDAVPTLQGPRHKLILLEDLGILKFLFDTCNAKSNISKFAHLIALTLGLTSKSDVETIRKECQSILYDTKSSGKGGTPINKESIKEVAYALQRIGYKSKRFHLLD